jgi:anti-anti-sigma factor
MTEPAATPLVVGVATEPDGPTILASGELDLSTVDRLVELAIGQIQGGPARLTVDLAGVSFCDSAGINGLVKIRNASAAAGWSFRLINLSPELDRVVCDLTGLGEFLGVVRG